METRGFKEIYKYSFVMDNMGALTYKGSTKVQLIYNDEFNDYYAELDGDGVNVQNPKNYYISQYAFDIRSMIGLVSSDNHYPWDGWKCENYAVSTIQFSEDEIKESVDQYNKETLKTRLFYTISILEDFIKVNEKETNMKRDELSQIESQISEIEPLYKEIVDEDEWEWDFN